jgi:DNA-binding PadR family transcriptional regulator
MSFEDIDKALDIEPTEIKSEIVKLEISPIIKKEESDQLQKDYEYSRGQLYSIIEKGQEAINGILELAQESDSPRAYEVAGQLIKNVGDVTDKLIDLQKKMKDINQEQKGSAPTNVTNNAVFLGSTAELQKFLKSSMNQDLSK